MQQTWNSIKENVNLIEKDFQNVQNGNNSAGTRVRVLLQEMVKDCKGLRGMIQDEKNQRAEAKKSKA